MEAADAGAAGTGSRGGSGGMRAAHPGWGAGWAWARELHRVRELRPDGRHVRSDIGAGMGAASSSSKGATSGRTPHPNV